MATNLPNISLGKGGGKGGFGTSLRKRKEEKGNLSSRAGVAEFNLRGGDRKRGQGKVIGGERSQGGPLLRRIREGASTSRVTRRVLCGK